MTRRKPKKRGKKSATFSPTADSSSVGQTTRDFLAWDEKLAQASKRRVEAAKKPGWAGRSALPLDTSHQAEFFGRFHSTFARLRELLIPSQKVSGRLSNRRRIRSRRKSG